MTPHSGISFHYIDTSPDLDSVIACMQSSPRIAVDTEADSMHHYYAKVCLIQLSMGDEHYIIDPLADMDLETFLSVLSQKPLVLHGSDYDLRMMRASFGFRPQNTIYDTAIAAQLLGIEKFGLTNLVKEFFDVQLTDFGKKTDWSRRPLTPIQLEYASNDTRFLMELADILTEKLKTLGREEWHHESCKAMVIATEEDKKRDPEDEWRIKGKRLLDRQQLAILRELWYWREKEAQQVDLPPYKILLNQKMIEIATWASMYPDQSLNKGPKLPRNCRGKRKKALEHALATAKNLPKNQWPQHKKARPAPMYDIMLEPRIKEMVKITADVAQELGIAAPVLASRATLKSVAHEKPQTEEGMAACGSMMRWQAELLFPRFESILKKNG